MAHADYPLKSFGRGFCFSQTIQQQDVIKIQLRTTTPNTYIELIDDNDEVVNTYITSFVAQYANIRQEYQVRIEDNGASCS